MLKTTLERSEEGTTNNMVRRSIDGSCVSTPHLRGRHKPSALTHSEHLLQDFEAMLFAIARSISEMQNTMKQIQLKIEGTDATVHNVNHNMEWQAPILHSIGKRIDVLEKRLNKLAQCQFRKDFIQGRVCSSDVCGPEVLCDFTKRVQRATCNVQPTVLEESVSSNCSSLSRAKTRPSSSPERRRQPSASRDVRSPEPITVGTRASSASHNPKYSTVRPVPDTEPSLPGTRSNRVSQLSTVHQPVPGCSPAFINCAQAVSSARQPFVPLTVSSFSDPKSSPGKCCSRSVCSTDSTFTSTRSDSSTRSRSFQRSVSRGSWSATAESSSVLKGSDVFQVRTGISYGQVYDNVCICVCNDTSTHSSRVVPNSAKPQKSIPQTTSKQTNMTPSTPFSLTESKLQPSLRYHQRIKAGTKSGTPAPGNTRRSTMQVSKNPAVHSSSRYDHGHMNSQSVSTNPSNNMSPPRPPNSKCVSEAKSIDSKTCATTPSNREYDTLQSSTNSQITSENVFEARSSGPTVCTSSLVRQKETHPCSVHPCTNSNPVPDTIGLGSTNLTPSPFCVQYDSAQFSRHPHDSPTSESGGSMVDTTPNTLYPPIHLCDNVQSPTLCITPKSTSEMKSVGSSTSSPTFHQHIFQSLLHARGVPKSECGVKSLGPASRASSPSLPKYLASQAFLHPHIIPKSEFRSSSQGPKPRASTPFRRCIFEHTAHPQNTTKSVFGTQCLSLPAPEPSNSVHQKITRKEFISDSSEMYDSCANDHSPTPHQSLPCAATTQTSPDKAKLHTHLGKNLLNAAQEGKLEVVRKLLDEGAYPDFTFGSKWTPLHRAAAKAHPDVVSLLLERGADVSARTCGYTALHMAAYSDKRGRCADLIINAGSELESTNNFGRTPLHYAAEYGNEAVARALLQAGACSTPIDREGNTPLSLAKKRGMRRLLTAYNKRAGPMHTGGQKT